MHIHNRYQAFFAHIFISCMLLAFLLFVIFYYWFPYDLIYAGGIEGLKILASVDLVLGPALTLIIFNRAKKSLKLDLSLIALLQFSCLAAGLFLIYNQRPVVQVITDEGVDLISAYELKHYDVQLDTSNTNTRGPQFILLDLPEDKTQIASVKFNTEFVSEKPFSFRSDLYLPMNTQDKASFLERINFIKTNLSNNQNDDIKKLAERDCHWLPVHSQHITGYACVSFPKGIIRLSNAI